MKLHFLTLVIHSKKILSLSEPSKARCLYRALILTPNVSYQVSNWPQVSQAL